MISPKLARLPPARPTGRPSDRLTTRQPDSQTARPTDSPTARPPDRLAARPPGRPTHGPPDCAGGGALPCDDVIAGRALQLRPPVEQELARACACAPAGAARVYSSSKVFLFREYATGSPGQCARIRAGVVDHVFVVAFAPTALPWVATTAIPWDAAVRGDAMCAPLVRPARSRARGEHGGLRPARAVAVDGPGRPPGDPHACAALGIEADADGETPAALQGRLRRRRSRRAVRRPMGHVHRWGPLRHLQPTRTRTAMHTPTPTDSHV